MISGLLSVKEIDSAPRVEFLWETRISFRIVRWDRTTLNARRSVRCIGQATARATTSNTRNGALRSGRSSVSCRPSTATRSIASANRHSAARCRPPAPSAHWSIDTATSALTSLPPWWCNGVNSSITTSHVSASVPISVFIATISSFYYYSFPLSNCGKFEF